MTQVPISQDAVIHNVIKRYMSKRDQGRCMEEIREALGTERTFEHHASHGVVPTSAESKLQAAGVFKGAEGLRQFAESQEFWDEQPYGKRLYFDSMNYLHRDIVRAVVRVLDEMDQPKPVTREDADTVSISSMCQLLNEMIDGNDEERHGLLEPWKSTYARLRSRLRQASSGQDQDGLELNKGEFVGAVITVGLASSMSLDWAEDSVKREIERVTLSLVFGGLVRDLNPGRYRIVFVRELDYPDNDPTEVPFSIPLAYRAIPFVAAQSSIIEVMGSDRMPDGREAPPNPEEL